MSLYASDRPTIDNDKCIGSHGVLIHSHSGQIMWRGENRPLNPKDDKDYSCITLAIADAQAELERRKKEGAA